MGDLVSEARAFLSSRLRAIADPEKAEKMRAYMKTTDPFYGVQKPERTPIFRELKKAYAPADFGEYRKLITGLWELPHREEKYLALGMARSFPEFILPAALPTYQRFIQDGAWWDLVDDVAPHLVGRLIRHHPEETWPTVDSWIHADDMWLRRAAIICQLGSKESTDAERLFSFCLARADETEFFIRKAIGWALRQYAYTDPEAVAEFVTENRDRLAGLSFREATKHIADLVADRQ